eukprot:SAG31_NODE_27474_length_425_cov_1.119632_1_plen_122_part_00
MCTRVADHPSGWLPHLLRPRGSAQPKSFPSSFRLSAGQTNTITLPLHERSIAAWQFRVTEYDISFQARVLKGNAAEVSSLALAYAIASELFYVCAIDASTTDVLWWHRMVWPIQRYRLDKL